MHKYTFALLVVTIQILPLSLRACDCGFDDVTGIIHFKDGLTPNGPVKGDGGHVASMEGGCPDMATFSFRDYGPQHAAVPVVEAPPKKPAS